MSNLPGHSLDTDLNQFFEGSTSAPLPISNGGQEYHNMIAIRGSETLGGHQVEISQCYMLRFGSNTVCLHPPAGSTLDSLSSLISALQQHAPIFSFGPNRGRWPEAQNVSSVSNSGVLIPDQNPTSAPQCAMLSGPRNETVILNPFPPQAANFPAQNNYLPNPQPNYYNQGPVYLYSNPINSTVIHTVQNSYPSPSEFIPNSSEQNPNPHLP